MNVRINSDTLKVRHVELVSASSEFDNQIFARKTLKLVQGYVLAILGIIK